MRVEIIELLRCPAAHEPAALVTVANVRQGDRLLDATLGCVVCAAEYCLRDGVVILGDPVTASALEVDTTRTAALLGLLEPGVRVALCGAYASVATALVQDVGAVCVTVNASAAVQGSDDADHLVIGAVRRVPLADGSVGALAVDAAHVALLPDAARVVRRGGRVLAPSHAPVPEGCVELARDAREWVAEVTVAESGTIVLQSARARS